MWRRVASASLSPLVCSSKSRLLDQVAYGFNAWQSFSTQVLNPLDTNIKTMTPTPWGMKIMLNPFNCSPVEVGTELITIMVEGGIFGRMQIPFIAFVLGGPGSGKGTQCTKIAETFGFAHLSAGDLLRKEISSNTENGSMILNTIKEGKIVSSEVTVKLIQKAIEDSENDKFLIDGFPRSEENRIAYERVVGTEPDIVLFFHCPEEEMIKRVLSRNQGRIDDNIDTVKERLRVFAELNLPVIKHYSSKGKVHTIDGTGSEDEIFERVCPVFAAMR